MHRCWFALTLWVCNEVQALKTAPAGAAQALVAATNGSAAGRASSRQSPSSPVDVEYRVPMRQCGFGAPLLAQCCANLYSDYPYCGCWEKAISFRYPSMIQATIYRHNNDCLLALSGQLGGDEKWKNDSVSYIVDHDPVVSERLCDAQTVRGWADAAKTFFSHESWRPLAEMLAGEQCSGGVSVVSTSLGAAMAEILAGCANHGLLAEVQGPEAAAFQVGQLFTFGAPPTATEPISNGRSGDGCFPGQRIFRASNTTHLGATDMVPYSTHFNGFLHVRQDALQLIELPDGSFVAKEHRCEARGTVGEPDWNTVSPYLQKMWGDSGALRFVSDVLGQIDETHRIASYEKCLAKVPTDQLIAAESRSAWKVQRLETENSASDASRKQKDSVDSEPMPGFRRVEASSLASANATELEELEGRASLIANITSHAVARAFQDGYVA